MGRQRTFVGLEHNLNWILRSSLPTIPRGIGRKKVKHRSLYYFIISSSLYRSGPPHKKDEYTWLLLMIVTSTHQNWPTMLTCDDSVVRVRLFAVWWRQIGNLYRVRACVCRHAYMRTCVHAEGKKGGKERGKKAKKGKKKGKEGKGGGRALRGALLRDTRIAEEQRVEGHQHLPPVLHTITYMCSKFVCCLPSWICIWWRKNSKLRGTWCTPPPWTIIIIHHHNSCTVDQRGHHSDTHSFQ